MYYDVAVGPICVNISFCVRVGRLYYFYTCICVIFVRFHCLCNLAWGCGISRKYLYINMYMYVPARYEMLGAPGSTGGAGRDGTLRGVRDVNPGSHAC